MLADLLLWAVATFFLGMGVVAIARPSGVVDRFGIDVTTADGRGEIRAVYGGFGIAVAALLVWAVFTEGRGELWIPSVLAVAVFGMAVGRTLSMLLDRTRGSAVAWRFTALELVLAVALFASHTLR